MFLNMQFVPEYSNPLYLEELFDDDYRTNKKKENKNKNELMLSVKNEDINKEEKETENIGIHED